MIKNLTTSAYHNVIATKIKFVLRIVEIAHPKPQNPASGTLLKWELLIQHFQELSRPLEILLVVQNFLLNLILVVESYSRRWWNFSALMEGARYYFSNIFLYLLTYLHFLWFHFHILQIRIMVHGNNYKSECSDNIFTSDYIIEWISKMCFFTTYLYTNIIILLLKSKRDVK